MYAIIETQTDDAFTISVVSQHFFNSHFFHSQAVNRIFLYKNRIPKLQFTFRRSF